MKSRFLLFECEWKMENGRPFFSFLIENEKWEM